MKVGFHIKIPVFQYLFSFYHYQSVDNDFCLHRNHFDSGSKNPTQYYVILTAILDIRQLFAGSHNLFKRFFICVSYGVETQEMNYLCLVAGQNKNHTVVRFFKNLCDRGKFETITNFFPVRDHSFLPCDMGFSSIKRLLRKTDRICTPQHYIQLIIEASRCGRFSVHKVQTDEILSFKNWWPSLHKKTVNSNETSRKGIHKDGRITFKISSHKHFIFRLRLPGKVEAKTFINA
ncbi:hypothetical protein AGLY_000796 [Aphis glycines]|uniref:DUF7869 domain-containing protein n=1 Tax=Aphis glycines TaxID=307491 RepID=A0A6G0U8H8_APHGL|nr:hypothetical protein AGLY_000796 [Aphis glycines]